MVKPLKARRLPKQSSVSLREEDLTTSGPEQPCSAGNMADKRGNGNQFDARVRGTAVLQSASMPTPSNESSNPGSGSTSRSEPPADRGGDGSGALESTPVSNNQPNTVRHRPSSCPTTDTLPPPSPSKTSPAADPSCSSLVPAEHNHFSGIYNGPPCEAPQTAALGRDLYLRFLHEELRVSSVLEPPCLNPWEAASLDRSYLESLNTSEQARHSLRQVADVFAMSEHRGCVRQRAASVNIESLDYNSFQDLLLGLFQEGGVTSERVVVLFFFCADLTIRALQEQLTNSFHCLLDWSQLYLSSTFALWVEQHGGWAAVLDQSANHVYMAAKIGLACAGIVALCVYIRNSR